MKLNYIIIPLITILVSLLGSQFTSAGIGSGWYDSIAKPGWTPPGALIGAVWTVIFILSTISALIIFNRLNHDRRWLWIIIIFLINAALNIFWSYLFFKIHLMGWAALEAGLLGLSVVAIIILSWPLSRLAAGLLIPYAAWVSFATYLTYTVWRLNL